MFNPDVIPVEQARNDSKGNFFNFLENEKVNMNTEEPVIKAPVLNIELPKASEENKEVQEPLAFNNNQFNVQSHDDEDFDPVDLIDTLEPDYEEKQEEKLGIDLKTAISSIREVKDSLLDKGFDISLEETDLNDIYEFIIKIKKD